MKRESNFQTSTEAATEGVLWYEKVVLRNFAKFTGKHLYQGLFFDKVAGLRPTTLSKKKLWHRCFPVNFAKFLIAPFLQNTSGRLLLVFAQNRSSGLYFFVLWFVHSLIMILLCSVRACNIKYLIFTQNLKQPDCSHIMLLASRNKINRWSWKQLWPSITRPRYYAFNWVY